MKHLLMGGVILAFVATGCDSSRLDSELAELKKTNAELLDQIEAANTRIEQNETQMTSLQTEMQEFKNARDSEMQEFKNAYDSEKRQQLTENVNAVEGLLTDVRQDIDAAKTSLKGIQELKAEIEKLRNLCVKHEAEAKDANEIGMVKTSVASLKQSVEKLERSIGTGSPLTISGKIRKLESDVRRLRSKVR